MLDAGNGGAGSVYKLPQVGSGLFDSSKLDQLLTMVPVDLPGTVEPQFQHCYKLSIQASGLCSTVEQFTGVWVSNGPPEVCQLPDI